jgi:3-oxoacyl-[acyl-carrier-protein] synthase II
VSAAVITGAGVLGPWGVGLDALRAELAEPGDAAEVPAELLAPHLSMREGRRMSQPSRFAVVASRLAAAEAGWVEGEAPDELAVCLGTSFGPARFTDRILDQLRGEGPEAVSPFLFMESVANAHAGQVAMDRSARGPNVTITGREASGALACAHALALVEGGRCRRALAGSVDELGAFARLVLGRFGALAGVGARDEAPDRAGEAHPLAPERDGLRVREGATVLAVEREEDARARGAEPLARLVCGVRAFDPSAPQWGWGTGAEALGARLARGLERAGLAADDLDAVVSGASGSRDGDALEERVLDSLFGGARPAVHTPKGALGEYGGGQLGAALALLRGPGAPRRVLLSSLAAGGNAAWLVLEGA